MRPGSALGSASTLPTTGGCGARATTLASSGPSLSAAGAIRGQWKGAETARTWVRRAPASRARAQAASTAAVSPATTVCCGAL